MMMPDDPWFVELVKRVDIFKGLSPHDVHRIYSKGVTHMANKDQTVFEKGTTGNQMYVVLGGKVGVFDGPKQIATLKVGETFGEMALLSHEPRTATVRAMEDTKLFILNEHIFQKLLTKRVAIQILLNISTMLGKKLTNANMLIREMEGR